MTYQPQPTSEQQQEPLSCPFCGATNYGDGDEVAPRIACQTKECPIQGIAIHPNDWNRRAQPKPSESVEAQTTEEWFVRQWMDGKGEPRNSWDVCNVHTGVICADLCGGDAKTICELHNASISRAARKGKD